MYRGFNLTLDEGHDFGRIDTEISEQVEKNKDQIRQKLHGYLENGALKASKIHQEWFTQEDADVFISHSHKDQPTAIRLASWLKLQFGLRSFIDSTVWGHAVDLQKMIDDSYNKIGNELYEYGAVLRSSAHVHMMLSGALSSMINRTECIIFLSTPDSLVAKEIAEDKAGDLTASPWIYHELITSKYIEKIPPTRTEISLEEDMQHFGRVLASDSLEVHHDAETGHLAALTSADLEAWEESKKKGSKALDWLYKNKWKFTE